VSFNGNKIITTSGGGAIISNYIEYTDKARFYSNGSRDSLHYYSHSDIGYNYRMSNVLAGIGRGQLKSLDRKVEAKRLIYSTYKEILGIVGGIHFLDEPENAFCNRWLTNVIISKELLQQIDIVKIKKRFDELNIETRFYGILCTCNQYLKVQNVLAVVYAKIYLSLVFACQVQQQWQ